MNIHSSPPAAPCVVGDRIQVVRMATDDPCPIESGTSGTVRGLLAWPDGRIQVSVDWDARRSLALIWPEDEFTVVGKREEGV